MDDGLLKEQLYNQIK